MHAGSAFEPTYAKGGFELFLEVEEEEWRTLEVQ